MARHYSTQEALDIIMHSDCEDGSSSSSVDSEADTEEASESTEDASEVGTDQLESNSDSSETEKRRGPEVWSIFRATMSHKRFHQISRTLRFDDKLSRPQRRDDKLAAFRKSSDVLGLSLGNTDFQLPPKIFYGVEIWRLARPLQDLEMLLTKPLLRCPRGVFGIIVMLKDPATKTAPKHDVSTPMFHS
ncbi:hypothetical protein JOQ06_026431, partial [Pogonophryne albipinna]